VTTHTESADVLSFDGTSLKKCHLLLALFAGDFIRDRGKQEANTCLSAARAKK